MELTQKGEVVSRLQAKAGQIGKILNNLEKYNHLLKDDKKSSERRCSEKRQAAKLQNKEKVAKTENHSHEPKRDDKTETHSEQSEKVETGKEPATSESIDSFVNLEFDAKQDEFEETKSSA